MQKTSRLGGLLIVLVSPWILLWFVGGNIFGLLNDSFCFKYLGCNAGFFGYDALLHFLVGMIGVILILWLGKKWQKFNFLGKNIRKNVIVLIAIIALLGVSWEMWEFTADHARINVLQQNLFHPNRLWQVSNDDTMGDMFFGLLGAAVMIAALGFSGKKYLLGDDEDSEVA